MVNGTLKGTLLALLLVLAGCSSAEGDALRSRLDDMRRHRYSVDEMSAATGLPPSRIEELLRERGLEGDLPERSGSERLLVLPYPGGRHPRIGFLEGAVNPRRDTKASVFLPWPDAGYVVVDLPEALWSNLGLTYLAHEHIPTIWDEKGVELERIEWTREPEGALRSRRVLPNGIEFSTSIVPHRDHVEMEMRVKNGTPRELSELRAQICVLLKGAPAFDAQTNDNKVLEGARASVRSEDGRRWIETEWEGGRAWANPPCPCLHSDPIFPDLAPGEEAVARGKLFFRESVDGR